MNEANVDLSNPCPHVQPDTIRHVKRPGKECSDCVLMGGTWVHLRECLTCGHIACCDSSPNKHATKHFHATKHPIVTSLERGETWAWCYEDNAVLSE